MRSQANVVAGEPQQVEFEPLEWRNRPASLRGVKPITCNTDGSCGCPQGASHRGGPRVFVCRHSDGGGCGRYICACAGSAGSNLCDDCWVKRFGDSDEPVPDDLDLCAGTDTV